MKKRDVCLSGSIDWAIKVALAALGLCFCALFAIAQEPSASKGWPKGAPAEFGFNADKLAAFDADLAAKKYGLVDSVLVLRCGTSVFDKTYKNDYAAIYGQLAQKEGPLNHDLHGPYNYFSTEFHPFYRGSDMHTMQSVTKTVTSIIFGIARTHNDFSVSLDTPILKYFDAKKVANLDERKKRITLRHLLTMTSGIAWHEDLPYNDPRNSADLMEASRDWVQYAIDQPMANEPGAKWVYSSSDAQLLAHLFKKITGKNVDDYAVEHLFKPLGLHFFWKHTPTGLPDTEGGLYLSANDLARIGQLFLKDGMWEGKAIVSSSWIKESTAAQVEKTEGNWKYGYLWWLQSFGSALDDRASVARGFGGQQLFVVPAYDMVIVFTGWDILEPKEKLRDDWLDRTLGTANRFFGCSE